MMLQLAREQIQIRHIVDDFRVSAFARHPRRTHARVALIPALGNRVEVETRKTFRRDDQSRSVIERCELLEEAIRELTVSVTHDPQLARKTVRWPRSEEHTSELQSLAYLVC